MIVLLFVVFFTSSTCTAQHEFKGRRDVDGISLFSGLDTVLKYFRTSSEPLAQRILQTFEKDCFYMADPIVPSEDDPSRPAVISIEGNYRPSRDSIGLALARLTDGRYLNNPAPCLVRHLQQLAPGSVLRRAYYILSLYATDFNARVHLSTGRTVIMNGGWLDQLTFTLLQTFDNDSLPHVTSPVYQWPSDLLRPDVTIYLTLPDGFQRALADRGRTITGWQKRSFDLYQSLKCRYDIMIENNRASIEQIHKAIEDKIGHKRDFRRKEASKEETDYARHLFSGLDGILSFLRNHSNPTAHRLVETFESECYFKNSPNIPEGKARKPFIVIEGNGHSSRDVVGKAIARMLNARYMVHPATCLIRFLDIMPKGTVIRRAYYALSLYAMSFYIQAHLGTNKGVVLNGYWLDQVSFSLIQSYPQDQPIPPGTRELFRLPEDMVKPDLIFYLHLSDEMRNIDPEVNKAPSWYTRALELYESWQSTYPIVVEYLKGDDKAATASIFQYIQNTLTPIRNVVQQDYGEEVQVMQLFGGLEEVLNFFRNSTSLIAKDILRTYEDECQHNQDPVPRYRKPFIVLEGNNRTSRGVVAGRLSQAMQGLSLRQPPQCLRGFVHVLPRSSMIRRAFFILCLFVSSADIRQHLMHKAVFLNGYWLDQLTFAMIQSFPYGKLPPISSPIFQWPQGLLEPDMTFYLNYPDDLQSQAPLLRSPRNWKPRSLELYQQLQTLYNIRIYDMTAEYWKTSDQIYQFINYNLDQTQ